jgi:putative ABC transport system permease protein
MLTISGCNVWLALFVAFLVGMLAGLCTGLLHTRLGIPPILSGILTQIALFSINLHILKGSNKALSVDKYDLILSSRNIIPAIITGAIFCAVLIALLYWYFGTAQGSAIRATGCNPAMSKAQGINNDNMKLIALCLSNGLVAVAGGLLSQFQGFADVNMGRGAIVIGLAAVIIGESLISHRTAGYIVRLITVIIGGIIYFVVYQTVIFLGLDANLLKMLSALVVAVFLGFPYVKKTYFKKKTVTGGKKNA